MSDSSTTLASENLIQFMGTVEAFSPFAADELEYLAEHSQAMSYNLGDSIINIGETAKGLYLIRSGRVRLFANKGEKEKSVEICSAGDTFGEIGVLKDRAMEYAVRASDKTEIILFQREKIMKLLLENKSARDFMVRYIAFRISGGFVSHLLDLRNRVERHELKEIVCQIGVRRVSAGERILTQDSSDNRDLYLIRSGHIRLVRQENETDYDLTVLGTGEVFGEKACLNYSVQQVSAIADCDSILLIVPQKTLHFILERHTAVRQVLEKRIEFLENEVLRIQKLAERKKKRFSFDTWSLPNRGEKILRGFPFTEQAEERDCGAACLSMICKHYDIPISLGKLREIANVTTEGSTMESLSRAGESLGFTMRGVKCTYQTLHDFNMPLIVHWKGYHYIIVYGISKNHVWVADPGMGFQKMTVAEFEQGWTGNCLVFTLDDTVRTNNDSLLHEKNVAPSPWSRFAHYLTPFKKNLSDIFIAALMLQILGIAPPIIIQNILDRALTHQSFDFLNVLIAGFVIITIFSHITGFINSYMMSFLIRKLDFGMISHFYKYVLALPISFFAKRKTGDIMARFYENNTVRRFMTQSSISTVINTLMIFTYFIVMFMYNVKLTLMMMAFLPPMILLILLATPKYKDYARKTFYAGADAQSLLVETLGSAECVKGMGVERSMRLKWEKKYAKTLHLKYRSEIFTTIIGTISGIIKTMTYITLLWTGSRMVMAQELTIGQLMAFHALIGSVMSPVMSLVMVWNELQETLVAMERLGDVLDLEPEQSPKEFCSKIVLPDMKGDIRFENVYFRYGDKDSPHILKNINLNIRAGSMVALVGPSGSGKSTFAKLLVGFYKPCEGRIYVDDYDLNMIDKTHYRSQIGYVMQSNQLFSGTVSENIALGDPQPDFARITESAKLADADGFIRNLSMGYEQVVGERGIGLSEGQIQRICIARALYHDPRILIMDEATSALDSETESHIKTNLRHILKGRTAIVIAHRLSTIMNADHILVVHNGAIAEHGSHQELFGKKGMYYQLVQRQQL